MLGAEGPGRFGFRVWGLWGGGGGRGEGRPSTKP